MEVVPLLIYNKYFRDFDNWPLNRVWPLNGGSTVLPDAQSTVHLQGEWITGSRMWWAANATGELPII